MSDKTNTLGVTLKSVAHKMVWLVIAFALGLMARGLFTKPTPASNDPNLHAAEVQETAWWTCSMHPQVHEESGEGLCPFCGMELIPLVDSGDDIGPRQLSVSTNAAKLMSVETVPVERRFVSASVRMVGKVDYDETRLSYITAWIPGRMDRLYVDYTGLPVRKGDHMAWLYSPELISAQEALLQALKTGKNMKNGSLSLVQDMT
ncbi:MAG: efflux RND transporter periplasmic adaptor subunit, partial [Planctomycetes bacterium]|nr:efflux RND transporter periplasmic adaptor subunit [Planctomycetota bacterium]